jgi:hypothetical protein
MNCCPTGHPDNPVLTEPLNSAPTRSPLTYLACPYSHPIVTVMQWRYEEATKAAAYLISRKALNVFSPITHSHPLHLLGGCRGDWDFWKKIDEEYLECSWQLVVLLLAGWRGSTGVMEEINIAKRLGIRIRFLLPTVPGYLFVDDPDSVKPFDIPIADSSVCEPPCSVPFELRGAPKVPEGMDNPKDLVGMTKPPLRLVPGALMLHCARVMALGARKYGPYNWREKAVRYTIYLEAAMRHIISALDGEENDPESGEPHTAHAAACMGIVLDAKSLGKLIDDRPFPGKSAELIKQMTEKK